MSLKTTPESQTDFVITEKLFKKMFSPSAICMNYANWVKAKKIVAKMWLQNQDEIEKIGSNIIQLNEEIQRMYFPPQKLSKKEGLIKRLDSLAIRIQKKSAEEVPQTGC